MASKDEMKKALQDQIKQLQLELKAIDEPAHTTSEPDGENVKDENHADRKSPKSDR